jgi:hypothetical protein
MQPPLRREEKLKEVFWIMNGWVVLSLAFQINRINKDYAIG